MKIIPLSLFLVGITLFSCSNESTNDISTGQKKVKLNKNEVLSISCKDARELSRMFISRLQTMFLIVMLSSGIMKKLTWCTTPKSKE